MRYFVAQNNSRVGPFAEEDIVARIRAGEFPGDVLGWREGTPNWVHLRELFPQLYLPGPAVNPVAFSPAPVPGQVLVPAPVPVAPGVAPMAHVTPMAMAAPRSTGLLGERFIALFIDGFILSFLNALAILLDFIPVVPHIVVTVCYAGFTIGSSMQATFGMKLIGLRVIKETAGPVDLPTAFIRALMAIVSGAFMLTIGYWWAFFDERNQTLHDKVAGTLVIQG